PFLLMRRSLPHMYARGWGRLINISSVHGIRASAYKSAYVAAKHALEGLSKVAAIEGAPHGVTSNCINPGYVRTPLVENQIRDQAAAHGISPGDVLTTVLLTRSPVKRLLEADEVAAAALWLCSGHSSYGTGSSLPLDGGWSPGRPTAQDTARPPHRPPDPPPTVPATAPHPRIGEPMTETAPAKQGEPRSGVARIVGA